MGNKQPKIKSNSNKINNSINTNNTVQSNTTHPPTLPSPGATPPQPSYPPVNYGVEPPYPTAVAPPVVYAPPPQPFYPPVVPVQVSYPVSAPVFDDIDQHSGEEKEPMLLLDITGSMNYQTSATDRTPRKATIREAILLLVKELGEKDSQAEHEEEGGLRTITFAGGSATDIGDLNVNNLKDKWSKIQWAGGTQILPGWNKLFQVYMEEFGGLNPESRPILMALIITDGEADDTQAFGTTLKNVGDKIYITIAIIGYGPDHDECFRLYKQIEATNSHVKIISFDSETNPVIIAKTLIKMVE